MGRAAGGGPGGQPDGARDTWDNDLSRVAEVARLTAEPVAG
ncbi:hypothetical protein [Tersicoccus solisilvae]|nr:hypothetical protein [Tersicoccus solisilvae]